MWHKEGDQNTKYFHHKASQRMKKNFIPRIKDDARIWRTANEWDEVIVKCCINLFSITKNGQQMKVVGGRIEYDI